MMSVNKANYPYKEALLSDAKGDLKKTWYVNYYVWSEWREQLVRKRGVFNQSTAKERYAAAKEFIEVINEALREGYIIEEVVSTGVDLSKKTTVKDATKFFLSNKEKTSSKNTIKGYTKDVKIFLEWAEENGIDRMPIEKFGTKEVFAFSDFLDGRVSEVTGKTGYSRKTYSNFIATLRTMWATFVGREILATNPFLKVAKRKSSSGQHIPYSTEQVREFRRVCLNVVGDEQLWLFVNFIYYGFFRPAEEAQMLRVKHILKKTIVVPAEIAKNNLTEHVRIPAPLEKLIAKYDLRSYPPNFYVFSRLGKPGPDPLGGNYMYMHNRKVLKLAELTDQAYDLYGWKHTGVIALYLATKDIKLVQVQCRHKDINTTDRYLRDLGMFLDEDALDKFPEPTEDPVKVIG